jgi:hypothetical protein
MLWLPEADELQSHAELQHDPRHISVHRRAGWCQQLLLVVTLVHKPGLSTNPLVGSDL